MTGEADRPPVKPGPCFGDTGTGMLMAITILGALLKRQRTGKGRRLQVAMQDAMLHYMRTNFATQARTGKAAQRRGGKTVVRRQRALRPLSSASRAAPTTRSTS